MYTIYSLGYSLCALVFSHELNGNIFEKISLVIIHGINSPKYHLWYLPAYVAVLLSMPLIKLIIKNADFYIIKYIIVLIVLSLILNSIVVFDISFFNEVYNFLSRFKVNMVMEWIGICILGYYLNKYPIKNKICFVVIGLLVELVSILFSYFYKDRIETLFYGNLTLQTTWCAAIIFQTFINIEKRNWGINSKNWITNISSLTLGIYLIHPMVLNIFDVLGINSLSFNALFSVPIIAILTFIICCLITFILKCIPIINKCLV